MCHSGCHESSDSKFFCIFRLTWALLNSCILSCTFYNFQSSNATGFSGQEYFLDYEDIPNPLERRLLASKVGWAQTIYSVLWMELVSSATYRHWVSHFEGLKTPIGTCQKAFERIHMHGHTHFVFSGYSTKKTNTNERVSTITWKYKLVVQWTVSSPLWVPMYHVAAVIALGVNPQINFSLVSQTLWFQFLGMKTTLSVEIHYYILSISPKFCHDKTDSWLKPAFATSKHQYFM